jgi:hypothetical protein
MEMKTSQSNPQESSATWTMRQEQKPFGVTINAHQVS